MVDVADQIHGDNGVRSSVSEASGEFSPEGGTGFRFEKSFRFQIQTICAKVFMYRFSVVARSPP